jgi:hypothetical protein
MEVGRDFKRATQIKAVQDQMEAVDRAIADEQSMEAEDAEAQA